MSGSLCIAETSPLPEAGADVITTDGDGALAHSCQDAARWGRGGVQAWNTIPLPSPLPEWVTGGWRGCVIISVPTRKADVIRRGRSSPCISEEGSHCWLLMLDKSCSLLFLGRGCVLVLIPTANLQPVCCLAIVISYFRNHSKSHSIRIQISIQRQICNIVQKFKLLKIH